MRNKLPHILTLFVVGCSTLLSQNVFGQEGGYPIHNFQEPAYQELNLNEDKPLLFEQAESRPSRSIQNMQRDSSTLNKSKAKLVKKSGTEKKEDDALSFNFLYYIIQKYKKSDIVDQ